MNILLIGATGMVGSRILNEAVARGHSVTAAARSPEKIAAQAHVTPVGLDINDTDAVIAQARSADVIVSAVSPRNSGDALKDAAAFTDALIAAHQATDKRIVMVGGAASLHMPDGTPVVNFIPEEILPEAQAMRRAYGTLVKEDIDFTVIAPGGMIAPGERTGQFRLAGRQIVTNADGGMSNISAEDFAIAVLAEIETPQYHRTIANVGY
ncbi:NAD(P)H-binding protein [Yoonia sp. SS1-5]|uniref:NAD(P)-dependent oxidoreductase n=1 Tax=Yoonia rhodophyticola TaxID=3137370 RepID=A0AAN0NLW0_9RHOB